MRKGEEIPHSVVMIVLEAVRDNVTDARSRRAVLRHIAKHHKWLKKIIKKLTSTTVFK